MPFPFQVVVRSGVNLMLERLAPFCEFYCYSHGLRSYVLKILNLLDPEVKWFKDRNVRVLAPRD